MFTPRPRDLLGVAPRRPAQAVHQDLAASVQCLLQELLLDAARHLHELCASEIVCYAGGVALNSVADRVPREQAPFRCWFVPPAPDDADGAVGAALRVKWASTRPCR